MLLSVMSVLCQEKDTNIAQAGKSVVLLNTANWGQGSPYNEQCPMDGSERSTPGCEAVAFSIIMKYYGYPGHGYGQTVSYITPTRNLMVPARNLGSHKYNWDLPTETFDFFETGQEWQSEMVATLLSDISASINADYTSNVTDAYIQYWFPAITKHFNYYPGKMVMRDYNWNSETNTYDVWSDENWQNMIESELSKGHPVLYHGMLDETQGHVFVIDGYTEDHYLHINMGWDGYENDYYTLKQLTDMYPLYNYMWLGIVPMTQIEEMRYTIGNRECPSLDIALEISTLDPNEPAKMLTDDVVESEYTIEDWWVDDRETPFSNLDLNGHHLKWSDSYFTNMRVTITDSKGCGIMNPKFVFEKESEMYINNVQIEYENDDYDHIFTLYNGKLTVANSKITNKRDHGSVICALGNSSVVLENVYMDSPSPFYEMNAHQIECRSGFFSTPIAEEFLAKGSVCVANTDEATKDIYPYHVVSIESAIGEVMSETSKAIKYIEGNNIVIQKDCRRYNAAGAKLK